MTRYEKRLSALREHLPPHSDGILITCEPHILWLTGFSYTDGFLLVLREAAFAITDFRYAEAAAAAVDPAITVEVPEGSRASFLDELFLKHSVRTLLYEDHHLTCAALEQWKKDFPGQIFQPSGRLLAALRQCKDEEEIQCIRRAQRIAERALTETLHFLQDNPHTTEVAVAAELEYRMRRGGSERPAFETIAVSGRASSLPHGVPRPIPLERGFLTMDFGATVEGYCSDMTRTVCLGRADEAMHRVYQTVLEAQTAALAAIGPDQGCAAIDGIARKIIDDAGYQGCFGHGLGHGVGLFIHEAPSLSPRGGSEPLHIGEVVTVEPGIYLPGRFGVRIEDMVCIRPQGAENLTEAPKQLLEIPC